MPEEMNWKKFLTENVLGECWDADKRPGGDLPNRTFDNQDDMMDLYEALKKSGRWNDFLVFLWPEYLEWLLYLDGGDYESRCKLVAEFYGWKEEK
jgi:hypothetical protein